MVCAVNRCFTLAIFTFMRGVRSSNVDTLRLTRLVEKTECFLSQRNKKEAFLCNQSGYYLPVNNFKTITLVMGRTFIGF